MQSVQHPYADLCPPLSRLHYRLAPKWTDQLPRGPSARTFFARWRPYVTYGMQACDASSIAVSELMWLAVSRKCNLCNLPVCGAHSASHRPSASHSYPLPSCTRSAARESRQGASSFLLTDAVLGSRLSRRLRRRPSPYGQE